MIFRFLPPAALLLAGSTLLLTACGKPAIRAYLAPKDPPPEMASAAAHAAEAAPAPKERPRPKITYTLPAGWKEAPPGQVSIAAFVAGAEGGEANVNVTPLPDLRGRELLVVNMYRQQTGDPPIEQAELDKTQTPIEVAGGQGQMLEFLGANKGKPTRLIMVIAHRDGRSWFYRISGDDAFVTAQKPAFLEFLKSVHIEEPPAAAESKSQP
jgi:hypothetical protein